MKPSLNTFTAAILLVFFIASSFSSSVFSVKGIDRINPYGLKLNGAYIFGNIEQQLSSYGLPKKISEGTVAKSFHSKNEILEMAKSTNDFLIVSYPNSEFWCFSDLESIPSFIDFRNSDQVLSDVIHHFSNNYTLDQFKQDFPSSFSNSPEMHKSFYSMSTGDQSTTTSQFLVERTTKSNPDVFPLVEFTFQNNKLTYVFFVNF